MAPLEEEVEDGPIDIIVVLLFEVVVAAFIEVAVVDEPCSSSNSGLLVLAAGVGRAMLLDEDEAVVVTDIF